MTFWMDRVLVAFCGWRKSLAVLSWTCFFIKKRLPPPVYVVVVWLFYVLWFSFLLKATHGKKVTNSINRGYRLGRRDKECAYHPRNEPCRRRTRGAWECWPAPAPADPAGVQSCPTRPTTKTARLLKNFPQQTNRYVQIGRPKGSLFPLPTRKQQALAKNFKTRKILTLR